jgi:arylsulfatase A-like enzyme
MKQHWSRRRFLQASLATIAAASVSGNNYGEEKKRPNILFIAFDDLNDWVNCLGGYPGKIYTPNIDALAASGTLFTNAHCAIPLCNASRTSTLTGFSPMKTGVFYNDTQWRQQSQLKNAVTLPQLFRNNGYRAVGAGKIFHFHDALSWDDFWPDNFHGFPEEPVAADNEHPRKGGPPQNRIDSTFDWGITDTPVEKTPDYQVADWIIKQLKTPQTQPLFLGYGLGKPHLPWYLPRQYFDLYPVDDVQLPAVLKNDLDDVPAAGRELINEYVHKDIVRFGFWKKAVQAYLASITYADEELGRVMQALRASPLVDNTIIVLWSDHGWHLGEKLQWRKLTLWEEATHIPLIISGAGIQPGQRCDAPVSLLDLYPTLADLAGINPARQPDGHSLQPLLQNPKAVWSHAAITLWQMHGNEYHFAVRDQRYRLIRYANGKEELYDHQQDPHEWHNLAGNIASEDARKLLSAKLDDYLKGLSAP